MTTITTFVLAANLLRPQVEAAQAEEQRRLAAWQAYYAQQAAVQANAKRQADEARVAQIKAEWQEAERRRNPCGLSHIKRALLGLSGDLARREALCAGVPYMNIDLNVHSRP